MQIHNRCATSSPFKVLIGFVLLVTGMQFNPQQSVSVEFTPESDNNPISRVSESVTWASSPKIEQPDDQTFLERLSHPLLELTPTPGNLNHSPTPHDFTIPVSNPTSYQDKTFVEEQDPLSTNESQASLNRIMDSVTDTDVYPNSDDCEDLEGCHQVQPGLEKFKGSGLNGTFMQMATLTNADIPLFFAEVDSLGMNTIILQNVRTKVEGCVGEECCTSADYKWLSGFPAKLSLIMDQAAQYSMEVYVGLDLTTHNICPMSFYKEPNASRTIEDTRRTVMHLEETYGSHSALAGWYIPDEPSLSEWIQPELAYDYYAGLANSIRRFSAKPILVSPHLINITSLSPAEMAWRAYSFQHYTGIEILLWQDAAGAEGLRMAWDAYSKTIGEYFAKITEVLGRDSTWSVHEAFNCCVQVSNTEIGAAYRPTSMIRFSEQLAQADQASVGRKITWIQQHHFGTIDPSHHLESRRLLETYRAYYGLEGEFLLPEKYIWLSEPDLQYSDSGSEMFNQRIGNPMDFTNNEWVGINGANTGSAEIVIDLGQERMIEWVGFHLLSHPAVGIRFPKELTLACSSGEKFWQGIDLWVLPIRPEETISEYLFANIEPISKECRKIKATLMGSHWIFLSEIEIVAESITGKQIEESWIPDILIP